MMLSVIVPVYNVEAYLRRCLDSVMAAVDAAFSLCQAEVICIDDGSTDGSLHILHEYAGRDKRIRVITQENQGLAAARNAGIDAAAGDWISFVESDDWVDKQFFRAWLELAMKENSQIAAVGTGNCSVEEYWCSGKCAIATAWGKLYSAKLWRGIRFPAGRLHEDEFTVHKVVFKVDRIAGVNKPLYKYMHRSDSIMHSISERNLRDWLEGCDIQAKDLRLIGKSAYAVALAKKIQVEHWMGNVQREDIVEYANIMRGRTGRYYWPEHYRHPILVNRFSWMILSILRGLLSR